MQLTHSVCMHTAQVYSLLLTMTIIHTVEESLFKAASLMDVLNHDPHHVWITDVTLRGQFTLVSCASVHE